jgi:hypothetical protein
MPDAPKMHRFARLLSLAALLAGSPAWSDDAGLLRCRALGDGPARLACYDALPLSSQAPRAASPQAAAPGGRPAPAAVPPAVAPSAAGQFGLAAKPAEELQAIHSSIPGLFEGWRPNERIRLANGQVWQVADDTSSLLQRRDPKVTVRRGALGAFYLDIEGDNRSPRVRRVQ